MVFRNKIESKNCKTVCCVLLAFVLSAPVFTSCDPALEETIYISNDTNKPLTIILEKKDSFIDTLDYNYQYYFQYANKYHRSFIGDSLLIVTCEIKFGEKLILLDNGPLGLLSIKSKEDGIYFLKEIADTIYLLDHFMEKSFFDKDNWELDIDSYKNGGGVSKFYFAISEEDFKQ
jgi:hypothetical protein